MQNTSKQTPAVDTDASQNASHDKGYWDGRRILGGSTPKRRRPRDGRDMRYEVVFSVPHFPAALRRDQYVALLHAAEAVGRALPFVAPRGLDGDGWEALRV